MQAARGIAGTEMAKAELGIVSSQLMTCVVVEGVSSPELDAVVVKMDGKGKELFLPDQ
jgi:hypothetical protein